MWRVECLISHLANVVVDFPVLRATQRLGKKRAQKAVWNIIPKRKNCASNLISFFKMVMHDMDYTRMRAVYGQARFLSQQSGNSSKLVLFAKRKPIVIDWIPNIGYHAFQKRIERESSPSVFAHAFQNCQKPVKLVRVGYII